MADAKPKPPKAPAAEPGESEARARRGSASEQPPADPTATEEPIEHKEPASNTSVTVKKRKMTLEAADQVRRLPDKGIPIDFIICSGALLVLAVIFGVLAFVLYKVADDKGILALKSKTFKLTEDD